MSSSQPPGAAEWDGEAWLTAELEALDILLRYSQDSDPSNPPAIDGRREAARPAAWPKAGSMAELGLAALVVAGLACLTLFFLSHGYLPSPFFADKGESLMDWFETAYWSRTPGAYSQWGSVYPPLSFVVAHAFSNPACYAHSSKIARLCDPWGAAILLGFLALGFATTFIAIRRAVGSNTVPRTIALCLGSSMLYGLERGNLVILAYPFFVLGFSNVLRSGWQRIACAVVALNLKPYLLLSGVGWLARRRWAWLASLFASGAGLYLATWAAFGSGSPMEVLHNMAMPLRVPSRAGLDLMGFSSSYDSLLLVIATPGQFPLAISPGGVAALRGAVFLLIGSGWIGWWACCLGAARRPDLLSSQRLAAISLAVLFSICTPGGYSVIFLLFLVFLEKWEGVARKLALV
ncbi:MAG: hypothetical protein JO111_17645, partial [Caulobacteraceae bacterium]|nr:hypothetical protein [Caulobacteraceae bacterium]